MEFSNLIFLYILLPLSILIYYLVPDLKRKNLVLLVISLLFYSFGQPIHMLLLVGLSYLNYWTALRINPEERITMLIPVGINLAALVLLRYLPFFPAAVGISFYTLTAISYLVDVYNLRTDPEEQFQNLLLYLMMFPKALRGPILRYEDAAIQITGRRHHPRTMFEGVQRFLFGLAKKVLLADACGRILETVYARGEESTLVGLWFSAILFGFRIYYDLSGFSDMAIGLGKIFGFHYGENFRRPYLALSVTDFCKRWNVSLAHFFRDYVYLPLGGNQLGKVRQTLNLLIVWIMVGLFHGLNYNFLILGIYFFVIHVLEKHFRATLDILPDSVCRCITLWLVLVGWILYTSTGISQIQNAVLAFLGFGGFATPELGTTILRSIPLVFFCFLGCTRLPFQVRQIFDGICGMGRRRMEPNVVTPLRVLHLFVSLGVMMLLLWWCTASLVVYPALPSVYAGF